MDLSLLTIPTVLMFLLMLTRVSGMLVSAPLFNHASVPAMAKVGMAAAISLILFPLYAGHGAVPANNLWSLTWVVGQEFVIGMLIGFVANLLFAGIQMAGSHVTMQMGLSSAQAIDPVSHQQEPIMGQFYFILATVLFLSLNIHHSLILAVAKSFEVVPLATGLVDIPLLTARFTALAGDLFTFSIMLVLPVFGTMLVHEVALAFMSKMMPQMNIFMVAMPMKIVVTLLLIYITVPFTVENLTKAFDGFSQHVMVLYQK